MAIVDVGLDDAFDASTRFVQSGLDHVNAGYHAPVVDIDFIRSREKHVVSSALTSTCSVLHVLAHGDHAKEPTFFSSDGGTYLSLAELGSWCAENYYGVAAGAVLADGCKTGTQAWQRAIRDCLSKPVTYIGTSSIIGCHESTVFCSGFYGALFRNRGRGMAPPAQARDAAERAISAYEILTDRKCPYKVFDLTPSRRALRAQLA